MGSPTPSGPECIEDRVERYGRDFLPHSVLEADHERLVDVEVDAVAPPPRAVDGEAPLVVCDDGVQFAAVRAVGLEAGAAQELDDLAAAAVLAAHHRGARNAPDDVAAHGCADLLRVLSERGEDAPGQRGIRMLAVHSTSPSVATTASAITFNGRCDTWLARRNRANASSSPRFSSS